MIEVYTDGAYRTIARKFDRKLNEAVPIKAGGHAFVIKHWKNDLFLAKFSIKPIRFVTSQQMELMAVLDALAYLILEEKTRVPITIYTDSRYIENSFKFWLNGWVEKGWRGAEDKCIKNVPLMNMLKYFKGYDIEIIWTKGHSDDVWNDLADDFAGKCFESNLHTPVYKCSRYDPKYEYLLNEF